MVELVGSLDARGDAQMPTGLMGRRWWLGAVLAMTATAAVCGEAAFPATKVLPLLEAYLSLPPAQRSHFRPAYLLHAKAGSLAGAQAWYEVDGRRAPVTLGADGRLARTPDLAQLRRGVKLGLKTAEGVKVGLKMDLEAIVPATPRMDARALDEALTQATEGGRKAGGLAAFTAPQLDVAVFAGAGAGEAVYADGRRAPLASRGGDPAYDRKRQKGALTIVLQRAPSVVRLEGRN